MHKFIHLIFLLLCLLYQPESATGQLLEGLYCGKNNCYDVLGVQRDTPKNEISKAYRALARKVHPDMHRGEEAKKEAETQFKMVATAYEILRDDEARADYDYMLDNPSEYYAHYYRYYRRRVAPKVDVRLVIFVTISIISIIQYYSAWQRYETAINYFMTVPKYRNKAMEMAQSQEAGAGSKGKNRRMPKSQQKEEMDKLIRKVIEENMDIKGAYAKPEIKDILWIQLIISPYTISMFFVWHANWIWRYTILKKPYGEDQKLYLIRKHMGMGQHQFNAVEEDKKRHYLKMELWIKEKYVSWKKAEDEEIKKQLADNPRYKQYRRFMKNHGPGRMTFED